MLKGARLSPAAVLAQFDEKEIGAVSEILSDDKNVDNKLEAVKMPLKTVLDYSEKRNNEILAKDGDAEKLQEIMERLKKDKK